MLVGDKLRIIVLGRSLAAVSAIHWIRKIDPVSKIMLITDTNFPGFIRSFLPYIVTGELKPEYAAIFPLVFLKDVERVELKIVKNMDKVRQRENLIEIEEDRIELEVDDKILVASGVKAAKPPINLQDKISKIYPLEKVEDAIILSETLSSLRENKKIGVIGDFYGLDIAAKLAMLDYSVSLYMDKTCYKLFDSDMLNLLTKILPKNLRIKNLDWDMIALDDLIIVRGYIKPNVPSLENITLGDNGGIIVDEKMKASEKVYAAGSAAERINHDLGISFIHLSDNLSIAESIVSALNLKSYFYKFKRFLPLFETVIGEKLVFSLGFSSEILAEHGKSIVSARHHFYISENNADVYIKVIGDRVTRILYNVQVICDKDYAYGLTNILNTLLNNASIDDVIIQPSTIIPFLTDLADPFIATCRGLWRKLLKL